MTSLEEAKASENVQRPNIHVTKESHGGGTVYNLKLQLSGKPDPIVIKEFMEIAEKHSLLPGGGCYLVTAIRFDMKHESFLGGMHVQPHKYLAVLRDLEFLGYKIIR